MNNRDSYLFCIRANNCIQCIIQLHNRKDFYRGGRSEKMLNVMRRFYGTEAIKRQIQHPINTALIKYNEQIRETRRTWINEQRHIDPLKIRREKMKELKRNTAERKWENVLKSAVQSSGGIDILQNTKLSKTSLEKFSKMEMKKSIERKTYLSYLASISSDFITKENLDERIDAALNSPVSGNLTTEQMVKEQLEKKRTIRTIKNNIQSSQSPVLQ